jgi:hypothetical protein
MMVLHLQVAARAGVDLVYADCVGPASQWLTDRDADNHGIDVARRRTRCSSTIPDGEETDKDGGGGCKSRDESDVRYMEMNAEPARRGVDGRIVMK